MKQEELLSINTSFFRHKTSAEPILVPIAKVLSAIRGPFYASQIQSIRTLKAQGKTAEANEVKNNLHAVTFCATFKQRRLASLCDHYNHLMVIDIDKLADDEIERVKQCLDEDPHVATYWESPSGQGYKGIVPLNYAHQDKNTDVVDMHHWAFRKLEEHFKTQNIELDPSGKDITRLCFMSWCPELVLKDECTPFYVDLDEMKAAKTERKKRGEILPTLTSSGNPIQWNLIDGQKQGDHANPYDRRLIERIYKYLASRNLSITSSYEEWVKVAFAIAQTFHSTYGRKIFMKLCELDGVNHNEAKSERLIYDAYTTQMIRSDFSTIVYLATRKGFIR